MDQSQKVTLNVLELSHAEHEQNSANLTIEALRQILEMKLTAIINEIKSDKKMHSYLQDSGIAPAELLLSYEDILKTNKRLVDESKGNPIVAKAAKCYFDKVCSYLNAKTIDGLDSKGKIGWFIQVQTKLGCCSHQLFTNFKAENDITNSPKEDYSKVWEKVTVVKADDAPLIKKQYKDLQRMLHTANSSALNQSEHEYSIVQKLSFGLSFTKYLIMNDSSKLRSLKFYRNPTLDMVQRIWNMPEMGATKHLSKISYQGVKSKIKIYLPIDGVINQNLDIFEERSHTIVIRVLSNTQLVKYPGRQQTGCCVSPNKQFATLNSAIIHFHGGGFISLSSRSMQVYTRKWANELGVPVFSVDYRMPPDHPFPDGPNDCLTAYRFIINRVHEFLNIKPTKVYLAGDSAGGNLACALMTLILKHKEPIPQGIYLSYPAADLRNTFTSSRVHSLTDTLLWPRTLFLCVNSYLKGGFEKANDPLASPVLLTEQYVGGKKGDMRFPLLWPKTLIDVGNDDPLFDDSLILMQRMVESNIDCECIVYDKLSHGFLNIGFMVKESNKTITNSIAHWKKLMQSNQKQ